MTDRNLTRRDFLKVSVLTIGGAALASCIPQTATTESPAPTAAIPTDFKFSTWGDISFYKDGFDRMQKDYPQYANVKWIPMQTDSGVGERAKLLVDFAAKSWDTMPDICEIATEHIPELAQAGIFVDLTEKMAPYVKDFDPNVLFYAKWNDKIWAVPWMPASGMLWYRKDIWDIAGVKAEDIETWADYLTAGKKIRDFNFPDGKKHYIHDANTDGGPTWAVQMMLEQQCSNFIDPNTNKVIIGTDPAFRNVMEFWNSAYKDGILLSIPEWKTPWFDAFNEGLLSSYISANWMDQVIQSSFTDAKGKWSAMKLPAWTPGGNRAALQAGASSVVVINKPDVKMDLDWAFLQHSFMNPEVTGDLLAAHMLVPAFIPGFDNPYYSQPNPYYNGLELGKMDREIQEGAKCGFNYATSYAEVLNVIMVEVQAMWAGKSVDQAIQDAAKAANAAVK